MILFLDLIIIDVINLISINKSVKLFIHIIVLSNPAALCQALSLRYNGVLLSVLRIMLKVIEEAERSGAAFQTKLTLPEGSTKIFAFFDLSPWHKSFLNIFANVF